MPEKWSGASSTRLATLIGNLQTKTAFPHETDSFRVIETHISSVLLTGPFAYKFKKPLELGFLDYSTLDKRRELCEREVHLGRRYAPDLYLGVVAIRGTLESPHMGGDGPILEYAVRMKEFPQDTLLDHVLEMNALGQDHVTRIGDAIHQFHASTPVVPADSPYGSPEAIKAPVIQNFRQMETLVTDPLDCRTLKWLQEWSTTMFECKKNLIGRRKQEGHVRECHGDLHTGNMLWTEGGPLFFDGIEFNEWFRCIDTMDEVAFLVMDLAGKGRRDLGFLVLDRILETTGDYEGVELLRFYVVYRAIVRAKVALFRIALADNSSSKSGILSSLDAFCRYLELAMQFARPAAPTLILMHGLSGSGKSTLARSLVGTMGAIRVSSDSVRKCLFAQNPGASAQAAPWQGIYNPGATDTTYRKMAEIASRCFTEGFPVIVDATFLKRKHRREFEQLAHDFQVPLRIIATQTSLDILKQRIVARQLAGADPSDATLDVLAAQGLAVEPLTAEERAFTLELDTTTALDANDVMHKLIETPAWGAPTSLSEEPQHPGTRVTSASHGPRMHLIN